MGFTKRLSRKVLCLPEKPVNRSRSSHNVGTIANNFLENSTVHGLGKIHGANTIFTRLFWIFAFTVIFSMVILSVVGLFKKVLSYKLITSVDSEFSTKGLAFPAVTFCNAEPFMKDKMEIIENLQSSPKQPQSTDSKPKQKSEKTKKKKRNKAKLLQKYNLTDLFQSRESFFEPDLCTFGRKTCNSSDFDEQTFANEGNCYTFNANGDKQQTGGGYTSGLFVILNINQYSYDAEESFEMPAAIKMTLHHPSDQPDITKDSMFAAPGQYNLFRITMNKVIRAQPPYKDNCTFDPPVPMTKCLRNCKIDAMMKNCGALDTQTYLALKEEGKDLTDLPVEANETTSDCIDEFHHDYASSNDNCHCDIDCHDITYDAAYSQGMWPPSASIPLWVKAIKKDLNKTVTEEYIKDNYVAINVHYADFHVKTTRHIPAFEWDDFLSALGGLIGLWIGASIYSVLELASFILELIAYQCLNSKPVRKISQITVAPQFTNDDEDEDAAENGGDQKKEDAL